ncbi:hypothetical protein G3I44_14190 [Halogeometricum borinquense]|uniref:Uncharacterized protein n=1 Tax=Halogeometricum borinquense TaxID=60847 RepID=A0A6C0UIR8_9EURY|nr:hypothetical protein [Halogeometricum borinquense]QIB75335.1 hypothetical protein G3I44_14190 [Halogeometricum borinquense]
MPAALISGGPELPDQPCVFELNCDECDAVAKGVDFELVEDGWNWATAKTDDGRQLGFCLCPKHSQDKETLDEHVSAYRDRLIDADSEGQEDTSLQDFDRETGDDDG